MSYLFEDVSQDFSDHALWWPKSNTWLTNTKWTLDQYGVQSDAQLTFTSMHKLIRLQLPDLRALPIRVDFSVSVFASVCKLCQDLGMNKLTFRSIVDLSRVIYLQGIRHAEELSFLRLPKVSNNNERRTSPRRRRQNLGTLNRHNSMGDSLANNTSSISTIFTPTTPKLRSAVSMDKTIQQRSIANLSKSLNNLVVNDGNLARTPLTPTKALLTQFIRPTNVIEKCKLNGLWFDSSRSLMEQAVNENDLILLRFKYYSFYDLNPKVGLCVDHCCCLSLFRYRSWMRYVSINCMNKLNGQS
jgi:kindlin 2